MLRWRLEAAIASEFWNMYGDGSHSTKRERPDDVGFQIDEATEAGAAVMKGVREMTSPEWKFQQTPAYVLSTRPVEREDGFSPPACADGLPDGANVFFRVKHGIIQEAELSMSRDEGAATNEKQQIKPKLQGRRLHEISDWNTIFAGLYAWGDPNSGQLVDWLSKMFPPLVQRLPQDSELGLSHEKIEMRARG
jgi:lipoate-protein ligase A